MSCAKKNWERFAARPWLWETDLHALPVASKAQFRHQEWIFTKSHSFANHVKDSIDNDPLMTIIFHLGTLCILGCGAVWRPAGRASQQTGTASEWCSHCSSSVLHVETACNEVRLAAPIDMLSERLSNSKMLRQSYLDKCVHAHSGFNMSASSKSTKILLMDAQR